MTMIIVMIVVLLALDGHVYLRTSFERRSTWPWWKYLPGGAMIAYYLEEREMTLVCEHKNTESESYLNPCRSAGCQLNGPVTYHLNCGSQCRDWCLDCGEKLYDSADEPVEMTEQKYICRQCETEGIQPGHFACGTTFSVPA